MLKMLLLIGFYGEIDVNICISSKTIVNLSMRNENNCLILISILSFD